MEQGHDAETADRTGSCHRCRVERPGVHRTDACLGGPRPAVQERQCRQDSAAKAAATKAAKQKAAKQKAAREAARRKAAAAAKAKAQAAARAKAAAAARTRAVLQAGPRATAAAKAAVAAKAAIAPAQARAVAAARAAAVAKTRAAAAAKAAATAKARAAAVAKSKVSKKQKKAAKASAAVAAKNAKAAARASVNAARASTAAARAVPRARVNAKAKADAATAARLAYIGYAKQRADLAAKAAKSTAAKAKATSKSAKAASSRSKASAKATAKARKKAAAANKKAAPHRRKIAATGAVATAARAQANASAASAKASAKAAAAAAKASKKAAKAAKKAQKKSKKKRVTAEAKARAAAVRAAATAAASARASAAAKVTAARATATGAAYAAAVGAGRLSVTAATAATHRYQASARRTAAAKATARKAAAAAKTAKSAATKAAKTAKSAKKAAGPNATWAPREDMTFNNPKGSRAKRYAIIKDFNTAIDSVPAGGQIRMAMYLFDIKSVANKLVAAHKRGVGVQIIIDGEENNKHIRKVKRALGKNKKSRSFVATCDHSCLSHATSVIHAKYYLFSVAGQRKYVSMISSANPYTGNSKLSWNNNHTIVGDKIIYDSLTRYFHDMLKDKSKRKYFRSTTSGKHTVFLYPQTPKRTNDIVWMKALNQVKCTTRKGYGTSTGRTMIRVANWGWTSARMDVAKKLVQLKAQGCNVQVMVNRGRMTRPVLRMLLTKTKRGQIPVHDGWYDANNDGFASLYVHHKMMTINGRMGARDVKITWTGSQNFTRPGTMTNTDIVLRIVDPRVTAAYEKNFAYIRGKATKRLKKVPWSVGVTGKAALR